MKYQVLSNMQYLVVKLKVMICKYVIVPHNLGEFLFFT